MPLPALSFRQYLTYLAHQYKAVAKQHHGEMLPLFARHIGRDSVVLDVGAHAGQFCKLFAGLAPEGKVFVHGEIWSAVADEPLPRGTRVRVIKVLDTLKVKVGRA